jgi:hypothetical protein
MRAKFKDFECYTEPVTTLFRQEVDVIVALVIGALDLMKCRVSHGTFILDGQKGNRGPQCLVRFDLSKGHIKHEIFKAGFFGRATNFASMAKNVINEAFGDFSKLKASCVCAVYGDKVLVLNTTFGRFLCSFYADFPHDDYDESTNILLVVAEAIACMGKEDKVLQKSASDIWFAETEKNGENNVAVKFVREAFKTCEIPELAAWKSWHDVANQGNLTLFFE